MLQLVLALALEPGVLDALADAKAELASFDGGDLKPLEALMAKAHADESGTHLLYGGPPPSASSLLDATPQQARLSAQNAKLRALGKQISTDFEAIGHTGRAQPFATQVHPAHPAHHKRGVPVKQPHHHAHAHKARYHAAHEAAHHVSEPASLLEAPDAKMKQQIHAEDRAVQEALAKLGKDWQDAGAAHASASSLLEADDGFGALDAGAGRAALAQHAGAAPSSFLETAHQVAEVAAQHAAQQEQLVAAQHAAQQEQLVAWRSRELGKEASEAATQRALSSRVDRLQRGLDAKIFAMQKAQAGRPLDSPLDSPTVEEHRGSWRPASFLETGAQAQQAAPQFYAQQNEDRFGASEHSLDRDQAKLAEIAARMRKGRMRIDSDLAGTRSALKDLRDDGKHGDEFRHLQDVFAGKVEPSDQPSGEHMRLHGG